MPMKYATSTYMYVNKCGSCLDSKTGRLTIQPLYGFQHKAKDAILNSNGILMAVYLGS